MGKELVLSKRMQSVADRVSEGLVLADVGCDHGYLSVWLCQKGKIPSAIAMDINEGPLERAAANAALYHLEDRISLRLSDGLMKLEPGEAESIAIAGMGGMLMIRILDARPDVLSRVKELVLEPQSDADRVRRYLNTCGFAIADEDLVLEDGKFYPVIRAVPKRAAGESAEGESAAAASAEPGEEPAAGEPLTGASVPETAAELPEDSFREELNLKYGRLLLERQHPVLKEYLEKNLRQTEELIRKLEANPTPKGLKRSEELKKEVQLIHAALDYYR